MNRLLLFLAGILSLLALSWGVLVGMPWLQLGAFSPTSSPGAPEPLSALALEGSRVYAAENCAACHTQQIAPGDHAALARDWGRRATVPDDFRAARPEMPGQLRIGPDLSDVGHRRSALALAQWLYAPPADSAMPPYRFLFEPGMPGGEIVPTPRGAALIAYLMTLEQAMPSAASASAPASAAP